MSIAPGTQMPATAATAPAAPASRSPSNIARFAAFNPGSVWLIVRSSMNVLSSVHRRRTTMCVRRCAMTPPPKLVAPITKNAPKILARRAAVAWSFMPVNRMTLQPIHQPGLGRSEGKPPFSLPLQRDEELLHELLCFDGNVRAGRELHLKCVLADDWLVLTTGAPKRHV